MQGSRIVVLRINTIMLSANRTEDTKEFKGIAAVVGEKAHLRPKCEEIKLTVG